MIENYMKKAQPVWDGKENPAASDVFLYKEQEQEQEQEQDYLNIKEALITLYNGLESTEKVIIELRKRLDLVLNDRVPEGVYQSGLDKTENSSDLSPLNMLIRDITLRSSNNQLRIINMIECLDL